MVYILRVDVANTQYLLSTHSYLAQIPVWASRWEA